MCKLFAYINNEPNKVPFAASNKIDKVLDHLFYINSYKQVNGSGLMWMGVNGSTSYIKDALSSTIFTQTNAYSKVKSTLSDQRFVAGHTRYSTVGSDNWENTHPFEFGKYLGMQNGTARGSHKTLVTGKTSPCEVDSASVFWSFAEQGIDATFENYTGEGVFMFFDKERRTFNIVKNDKRTLYIAELTESKGYIIATEADAIKLACTRANLLIKEPVPVDNDKLITFTDTGNITKRDLVVKVPAPVVYTPYNRNANYYNKNSTNTSKKSSTVAHLPPPKEKTTTSTSPTANYEDEYAYNDVYGYDPMPDFEYIGDCVISGDPILSDEVFFADSPNFTSARVFCSSDRVDEYEQLTGKFMYEINLSTGASYG